MDDRASDLAFDGVRPPATALLGTEGAAAFVPRWWAVCDGCWPIPSITASSATSSAKPSAAFRSCSTAWWTCTWSSSERSPPSISQCSISMLSRAPVRAVSAAEVTLGRTARFIGQQAVQLHGGMGMTEELAIGHYFKPLTAVQYEFGSTELHLARYAGLMRS